MLSFSPVTTLRPRRRRLSRRKLHPILWIFLGLAFAEALKWLLILWLGGAS